MDSLRPPSMESAADFVAALRQLKADTGLTYRQIEQRSESGGIYLARSTLAGALSRNVLPREEFLAAYIRSCGGGQADVDAWLEVRENISAARKVEEPASLAEHNVTDAADVEKQNSIDPPDLPFLRTRKKKLWLISGGVITVTIGIIIVAFEVRGQQTQEEKVKSTVSATGATASPSSASGQASPAAIIPSGRYRIRTAGGQCLSERKGKREGAGTSDYFYETSCRNGYTPITLRRWPNGTYKVFFSGNLEVQEPKRCLGVVHAGVNDGASVSIQYCGEHTLDEAEQFRVEPVEASGHHFQLRAEHVSKLQGPVDLCIGSPDMDSREWSPVFQLECDEESKRQQFEFQMLSR